MKILNKINTCMETVSREYYLRHLCPVSKQEAMKYPSLSNFLGIVAARKYRKTQDNWSNTVCWDIWPIIIISWMDIYKENRLNAWNVFFNIFNWWIVLFSISETDRAKPDSLIARVSFHWTRSRERDFLELYYERWNSRFMASSRKVFKHHGSHILSFFFLWRQTWRHDSRRIQLFL